ncbi:PREDICTED: uncharacterized protein LOC105559881 [Vollenhovia emeryi]|uniref:uncharacterized protein LOC105559881 n=1 Tax=Vollenhovia emeryi TaxID=411798 RepID=UPI0005F3F45F|nr:PREDICTED: uncharacterized protein LOC105559881 [Vollenhovia emeryi]
MDFIVDFLPTFIITLGHLVMFCIRIGQVDKFRELFERMSKDWALQKTHDEIKIMHEHAEIARLFTLSYFIVPYTLMVGYVIWMSIPEILDVISPMNESRPRIQVFKAQFFIDEEQYSYLIHSHLCLVILTIPVIYITFSTLFLTLTQHACGMCELLGYRAERLICLVKGETTCDLIHGSQTNCRNIAVFVRLHYNIIQFVDIIETCYTVPFLLELTGVVILLGITLMQLSDLSVSPL